MRYSSTVVIALVLGMLFQPTAYAADIQWNSWGDAPFEKAAKEKRLVILDLEAVWCHWCHVMDKKTYGNPRVQSLINSHFVAIRVDQDSRPDLANRWEDYGWPATILFDSEGNEIARLSGYIRAKRMVSLLKAFIADPTPGPSVVNDPKPKLTPTATLSANTRRAMEERHLDQYDAVYGSWGRVHKFLQADKLEYSMARAIEGDVQHDTMVRQTLQAQLALADPVWGGMYQYSHGGTWTNPHFEKIMNTQADNLRLYALGYALYGKAAFKDNAIAIRKYLSRFLISPQGGFYTSQDADIRAGEHSEGYFALSDTERLKQGVPRIDRHIYARENGWAIQGLAAAAFWLGDKDALHLARRAAQWIIDNRSTTGGGFSHGATDKNRLYLSDTLAMGRSFLALYAATQDAKWLTRARKAADFIEGHFVDLRQNGLPGFLTSRVESTRSAATYKPVVQRNENIRVLRFMNRLHRHTNQVRYHQLANRAMRYLSNTSITGRHSVGGVLLAHWELAKAPIQSKLLARRVTFSATTEK